MQLSKTNKTLLSQHLYWATNGYDRTTLQNATSSINEDDPFTNIRLQEVTAITGHPTETDFEIEDLKKLTYLNYEYFAFDGNISFLEYCPNIEVIDFGHNTIENIEVLKFLKKLKHITINVEKIRSLEPLRYLTQLETIDLSSLEISSLQPLLQHKKIKHISLGMIENEDEIVALISNQVSCKAYYKVRVNATLLGIENPVFWVDIDYNESSLSIEINAMDDAIGENLCKIAPNCIDNDEKLNSYFELANRELDKRIKGILSSNFQEIKTERGYSREFVFFVIKSSLQKMNSQHIIS